MPDRYIAPVAPRLKRLPLVIVGAAFLGVAVLCTLWLAERQRTDSLAAFAALAYDSRISQVAMLLQDAETSQRGFLLTGDESYLAPYRNTLRVIGAELDGLQAMNAEVGGTGTLIARLRETVAAKLIELESTVTRRQQGDVEGALDIVRSGNGQELMRQFRSQIQDLKTRNESRLATRFADAGTSGRLLQLGAAVALALVLGLAFLTVREARVRARAIAVARDRLLNANERLQAEIAKGKEMESQVRQMQKMEAVGQLTGGIAHDFNNMLSVVIGALNLLQRRLSKGDTDVQKFIDAAQEGAGRAATLTSRLLAFARQQPLEPEAVNANRLVSGMSDLLRRTLGNNVRIETVLAGGLWRTHADAGQLENAVLNLAVNARDAMPDGGRLTIETANAYLDDEYAARHVDIPPGQYVQVAVTDTGMGMSPAVIAKAFDPFFTTKPVGKGTGLGLSQVYGFVRQSNGHVKIYSEIGQGTTIKLYLPRWRGPEGDEDAADEKSMAGAEPAPAARELILVVEDEDRVRQISVDALRELGYTVLHASNATQALRVLDENPGVVLLFTDIVMPEINGRKLADEAVRRRPGLRVLYTTGYTRNAIVHNGVLDTGLHLIVKPYNLTQLAAKVGEVLSRPPGSPRPPES